MATYTYRCPECKRYVSKTVDGKVANHLRVWLTGNRLQRAWCSGSGRSLEEVKTRLIY